MCIGFSAGRYRRRLFMSALVAGSLGFLLLLPLNLHRLHPFVPAWRKDEGPPITGDQTLTTITTTTTANDLQQHGQQVLSGKPSEAVLPHPWPQRGEIDPGVFASRTSKGWVRLNCNDHVTDLRRVTLRGPAGNFSLYVYGSAAQDPTATACALKGWYFEQKEIAQFLNVSRDLDLIDVGANLGLVALQAAQQGRRVVAVEPIAQNALRLCRSVLDFGHASLVRVIQNAVSSEEKNVTMTMPDRNGRTHYQVRSSTGTGGTYGATEVYAIWLDRLLPVLPFKKAALKIDVEGHEGHVLAQAERLFREVDIRLIWMEWDWVKRKSRADYGGPFILQFMQTHGFEPFDLMNGRRLSTDRSSHWPFTVLWRKREQ